jgi:hypothetical protein
MHPGRWRPARGASPPQGAVRAGSLETRGTEEFCLKKARAIRLCSDFRLSRWLRPKPATGAIRQLMVSAVEPTGSARTLHSAWTCSRQNALHGTDSEPAVPAPVQTHASGPGVGNSLTELQPAVIRYRRYGTGAPANPGHQVDGRACFRRARGRLVRPFSGCRLSRWSTVGAHLTGPSAATMRANPLPGKAADRVRQAYQTALGATPVCFDRVLRFSCSGSLS